MVIKRSKLIAALSPLVLSAVCATSQAYEMHFGAGVNYFSVSYDTGDNSIDSDRDKGSGYHLNWGVQKSFGSQNRHFLGTGIDIDDIAGNRVMGYKAIDYQYAFSDNLRIGSFVGAASMDSGSPQNGYYYGVHAERLNVFDSVSIKAELRYGNGLARDRLLDDDPEGVRPDIFIDYYSFALSFNYRF